MNNDLIITQGRSHITLVNGDEHISLDNADVAFLIRFLLNNVGIKEVITYSSAEKTDSVPLTKEEAHAKGYYVLAFYNGDYSYKINDTEHLIRDGKEIASGEHVFSYSNGDYSYKINDTEHLIRNGKEIATGGDYVYSYHNGDYEYEAKGITHKFNKDGEEITK